MAIEEAKYILQHTTWKYSSGNLDLS